MFQFTGFQLGGNVQAFHGKRQTKHSEQELLANFAVSLLTNAKFRKPACSKRVDALLQHVHAAFLLRSKVNLNPVPGKHHC